jgi:hypothetical protein
LHFRTLTEVAPAYRLAGNGEQIIADFDRLQIVAIDKGSDAGLQ